MLYLSLCVCVCDCVQRNKSYLRITVSNCIRDHHSSMMIMILDAALGGGDTTSRTKDSLVRKVRDCYKIYKEWAAGAEKHKDAESGETKGERIAAGYLSEWLLDSPAEVPPTTVEELEVSASQREDRLRDIVPMTHKPFRAVERAADDALRALADPFETDLVKIYMDLVEAGEVTNRDVASFSFIGQSPALAAKVYSIVAAEERTFDSNKGMTPEDMDKDENKDQRRQRVQYRVRHILARLSCRIY